MGELVLHRTDELDKEVSGHLTNRGRLRTGDLGTGSLRLFGVGNPIVNFLTKEILLQISLQRKSYCKLHYKGNYCTSHYKGNPIVNLIAKEMLL